MKNKYSKTVWIDGKTKLDSTKLNNIENGVEDLFENALTASEIHGINGIQVDVTTNKEILVHTVNGYYMSKAEVLNAIAQAQLTDADGNVVIDLSGKADADKVYTKEESDSKFASKSDLGNIDLSGKADISSVYTKTESDNKFATKIELGSKADSSSVYTKTVSDSRYVLRSEYESLLARVIALETSSPAPVDTIVFTSLVYPTTEVAAAGGSVSPSSRPKLTKNNVEQSVTINYSSNQSYATVAADGKVTFTASTTTSSRSADITAKCLYNGVEYIRTATVTQAAYVAPADVYAITGSFSYSGTALANGTSTLTPTNTLKITKNGNSVSGQTITYASNKSYATVATDGKVTFTASENTSIRTATITATVSYEGHSYVKTAIVTQEAYVAPVVLTKYYCGYALNQDKDASGKPVYATIDKFVEIEEKTVDTFEFTIPSKSNTVMLICPNNKELTTAIQYAGGQNLNITSYLTSPTPPSVDSSGRQVGGMYAATYKGETVKVYQFRINGNYIGEKFTVTFGSSSNIVTPPAEEEPETDFIYAGGYATMNDTMSVSEFVEIKSVNSSTKTITFTVNNYNIVGVICPSTLSLSSAKHTGEIEEDLTSEMQASVTNVTYNNKSCKMYQFKYLTGVLTNENFTINFN